MCYVLKVYNQYIYGELSIFYFIFYREINVLKLFFPLRLYFDLRQIRYFYYVLSVIIAGFYFSHKI